MRKPILFILLFILFCSYIPASAEHSDVVSSESITDVQNYPKPSGGVNFNAVERQETKTSVNFYANAMPTASLTSGEYIYQQCMRHATEIYLAPYGINKDDITDIFYDIATANPMLLVHTGLEYSYNEVTKTVIRIFPQYLTSSLAEDNKIRAAMNSKINEYIEYTSECPDKIGKLLLIHDKIIEDCIYDYSPYIQTEIYNETTGTYETVQEYDYTVHHAYGVFVNQEAVCQGFSQAIHLICERLGINSGFVVKDDKELNHMWNYIEVDGEWYHLDLTWDEYNNSTSAFHNYFLISDNKISADHGSKTTWFYFVGDLKNCTSTRFENNHFFNFRNPVHISYVNGNYTFPLNSKDGISYFQSDTLYTGAMITSAPTKFTDTTGIFKAITTDAVDISAVFTLSKNNATSTIHMAPFSYNKNTIITVPYTKNNADQTFSCMFMDLDTLIPYSKKITIN